MNDKSLGIAEKYTIINGCTIRYVEYNPVQYKRVLMLIHGIGGSEKRWIKVAPLLSKYFRVIVPDIIGFGYSCKPAAKYNIEFYTDFLANFLKNIEVENENNEDNVDGYNGKINMVGSSFGGLLAAEFAARYGSKIGKLVLVSPVGTSIPFVRPEFYTYSLAARNSNYEDVLRAFRNMVYDPNIITRDMVEDFIKRMQLQNAIHAFDSTLNGIRHNRDLEQRLSKISSPVQIVWGRNDRIIPLEDQLQEYLKIPNVEVKIINECGHLPFLEKPFEFIKIVLGFLLTNN